MLWLHGTHRIFWRSLPQLWILRQRSGDPSFIIPGTKLNNRYIVGVTLSVNGEGITYLAYDQSIGCKVYLRNICHQTCAIVSAVHPRSA